jgi:hypothetical protein
MAKEQIAAWNSAVQSDYASIVREVQTLFCSTIESFAGESSSLTQEEFDTGIDQIFNIAETLARNGNYIGSSGIAQVISSFASNDSIDIFIARSLDLVDTLYGSEDFKVRMVAINFLGMAIKRIATLGKIEPYAAQIYTRMDQSSQDSENLVQYTVADALGPFVSAFVGVGIVDDYSSAIFTIINRLLNAGSENARVPASQAMSPIVRVLANSNKLDAYSNQIFSVLDILIADQSPTVRFSSLEVLAPVASAILGVTAYQDAATQVINRMDILSFDNWPGIRTQAITAFQGVIAATDTANIPSIASLVKFETINNLDLQNHADPDVKNAVIDLIPDKLTEYESRVDVDALVITQDLKVITGLLSIIGTESVDDADNVKAAAASAKATLTKIVDNLDNTVMVWVNDNFDSLISLSEYTPTFLEEVLRQKMTGDLTDVDIQVAVKCLNAGYDFVVSVDEANGTYTMSGDPAPEEQVVEEPAAADPTVEETTTTSEEPAAVDSSLIGDAVDGITGLL